MSIMMFLTLGIIGCSAGLVAGLLGLGGGIVVVPGLFAVLSQQGLASDVTMHYAIGTSVTTIFFTSLSALWQHHSRYQAVNWALGRVLLPGVLIGTITGSRLIHFVSSRQLQMFFAIFLCALAVYFLRGRSIPVCAHPQTGVRHMTVSALLSALAVMLGLGGGLFFVPYMRYCRLTMGQAVATATFCGLVIGAVGVFLYSLLSMHVPRHPLAYSTGLVYWPAVVIIASFSMVFARIGVYLTHRLQPILVQKLFALLMLFIGIYMGLSSILY